MKLPATSSPIEVGGPPFAMFIEVEPPTREEVRINNKIIRRYFRHLNALIRSKQYGVYIRDCEEKMRIEDGDMDRLRDESRALFDHIETIRP